MDPRERRMTYRVTSEWIGLKRQLPYPSIDFLHPKTFSVDWDSCVLIRSIDENEPPSEDRLEFEFVGKGFRKDAPLCTAGERLNSTPPETLLSLSKPAAARMFERRTAVVFNGALPWSESGGIYFRTVAVPFGSSTGELKYSLSAVSYKLTRQPLAPDQAESEFLEFRDGDWSPINVATDPRPALATA